MTVAPGADAGGIVLLDAVDRRARALQNGLMFAGSAMLIVAGGLVRRQGVTGPGLGALAAGLAAIVLGLIPRQRWHVEYHGHRIRFENGPTTAEQLFVDDQLVGRGGFGVERRMETTLIEGDRIIATSHAGLLAFGARIVVHPAGRHFLLFYDVVADYVERRAAFRAGHLALARAASERGELVLGGALADPVDGAVLLFRGDSPAVAERFAAADPYVTNGLVTRWRVRPWTTVVGPQAATPVPAPERASVP
jgi:uncharacterized protein YciI